MTLLFTLLFIWPTHAQEAYQEYKRKSEIPEPLFVDLVRNLQSTAGEWEINSLFYQDNTSWSQQHWAPEIEWVFRPGTAFEFELPMEGHHLRRYKIAIQQLLWSNPSESHLQGLQAIVETDTTGSQSEWVLYHIIAQRLGHNFSMLGLYGARWYNYHSQDLQVSLNQSFFYNHSREVDLGLELNWQPSGHQTTDLLQIVPQLHLALGSGFKIQFGMGYKKSDSWEGTTGILRAIWEHNKEVTQN